MSAWNKIRKLKRMPRREVCQRLGKKLNERRERRTWRRGPAATHDEVDFRELLKRCVRIIPGSSSGIIGSLESTASPLLKAHQRQARANADLILNGNWTMLGHPFDLTGHVDWHRDARTGYQWDRVFHADLPLYALPGDGDVKYPWELSRHQFLSELAQNYQLNGCEKSAARARDLLIDWIDNNPLYEGVNWTSGLEAGMRVISWVWTLGPLCTWTGWNESDLPKIASSLWDHGEYLTNNFSHFSSPYNHLIGEATGLLYAANLFAPTADTDRWNDQARCVLRKSGPMQFYDDHFCVEQAMGYHYYTLGFLCASWLAAREFGKPLDDLTSTIQTAFHTGKAFRRPNGTWPAIGDLDSARALPLRVENEWSFDSLQQLAAVIFDDPTLKIEAVDPGRELVMLTGQCGLDSWDNLEASTTSSHTQVFRDSGYAVGCHQGDWVCFEAGPVAHGLFPDSTPSTAHGHADTLQVIYNVDGEDVLADAGMPYYGGDQDWVKYFRSVEAHNAVEIENAEIVRRAGRLAWSHEVGRPSIEAKFEESCWSFSGTLNWPGVEHSRYVFCIPGQGLWIADMICADDARSAHWYWQLPDQQISLERSSARWSDMTLTFDCSSGISHAQLNPSVPESPKGWRCWGYGQRSKANRLEIQSVVDNELLMLTSVGRISRPSIRVQVDDLAVGNPDSNDQYPELAWGIGRCRWSLRDTHEAPSGMTSNGKQAGIV